MDLAQARRALGGIRAVWVATVCPDGAPHVVPLWFVWQTDAVYASARHPSRTWSNVELDPRVALSFDTGRTWSELRGAVIHGRAERLSTGDESLRPVMSTWFEKYRSLMPGDGFERLTRQVVELSFLRVVPKAFATWENGRD